MGTFGTNLVAQSCEIRLDRTAIDRGHHVDDLTQMRKKAASTGLFVNASGWILAIGRKRYADTADRVPHCVLIFREWNRWNSPHDFTLLPGVSAQAAAVTFRIT